MEGGSGKLKRRAETEGLRVRRERVLQKLCVSIVPLFNHLDESELNEIVRATRSVSYRRGETIYRAGEKSEGLYIVHKGRLKIYRLSNQGREQLMRVLGPGDFTGELSLFTEQTHDAYAEAQEAVEICLMDAEKFQQFLKQYPAISLKMLGEFSSRLAQTENQAANIALESTETRIAMYLAEQAEAQQSSRIVLTMSRKDLASYLGTTPETLSRKLAEFEDAGWIRQLGQREIEIVDIDELLLL